MSPDGGLVFSTTDISATSGLQNIATDLLARLRTPIGMLPWNPGAGSYLSSLVGQNSTQNIIQKINAMAQDSIYQDSRIGSASTQVLGVSPTYVQLQVSAQLTNNKTVPVSQVTVNG